MDATGIASGARMPREQGCQPLAAVVNKALRLINLDVDES